MQKMILQLIVLICVCFSTAWSQNKFLAIILDEDNREPLAGANVILQGTAIGASADLNGIIEIANIPDGKQIFIVSFIGYQETIISLDFPLSQTEPLQVLLTIEAEEMEAVLQEIEGMSNPWPRRGWL